MSSANPRVHEPSMEEILASIRRIIADDQDRAHPSRFAEPPAPAAERSDRPLVEWEASPSGDAAPVQDGSEIESEGRHVPRSDDGSPGGEETHSTRPLLSAEQHASVSQSFERLASTLRAHQPRSLEEHVIDMLRPLLQAWLDDHLPPLVEGLVRDEIERFSRRR